MRANKPIDVEQKMKETIRTKLQFQKEISEEELEEMLWLFEEVFQTKGEDRRWSRPVTSVVEVDNDLYAIEWEKALTEMQEDQFLKQPYKVKLDKKEITTTETRIVKL